MVSVTATDPKVRGFKPGQCDGFLRAIKIHSTLCFGGEVKPEGPYHKDLRHVKNHLQVRTKLVRKVKFIIPLACSSCLLPDDSAGRIYRELWWTNKEFSSVDITPPW
jgi:hypothetical protein